MEKRLIVLGAGPAGIEAALTAARAGARVTVVHEGPLGGRAAHGSLLPSKVWLSKARRGIEPAAILARLQGVARAWIAVQSRLLDQAGVTCIQARGRLAGPGVIEVEGQAKTLDANAVILASGSEPSFRPELKPDGKRVIAPRLLARLDWLPARVVVIGGGATGSETAYLFNALGCAVTWLPGRSGVLPEFARPAADGLRQALSARGVHLVDSVYTCDIERRDDGATVIDENGGRHEADLVFVATGRHPDLSAQGLESLGLDTPPRLDGYGQAMPGLYVVGDAAGEPFLANRALLQARIAARHALGLPTAPVNPELIVHAVYSQPEVAQVGRVTGEGIRSLAVPLDLTLKAHLLEPAGEFTLAWDTQGRVRGAWVVGAHAADALAPVAAAIAAGAGLEHLAHSAPANPTLSELATVAARIALDQV